MRCQEPHKHSQSRVVGARSVLRNPIGPYPGESLPGWFQQEKEAFPAIQVQKRLLEDLETAQLINYTLLVSKV